MAEQWADTMVTESETITPEDLQKSLEWAGMILLSMDLKSPMPGQPHSAWPSYTQDINTAYGYSGERLRAGRPTAHEIELMDKVLALPQLAEDLTARRLLNARALVAPVSNRHLYSWTKLAFMLHSDRRKIARIHHNALREIIGKLSSDKSYVIRQSLSQ